MSDGKSSVGPNSVVKTGWLVKRGQWMPTWKRRWFVLKGNGALTYFTNAIDAMEEKDSKGSMEINGGTVEVITDAEASKKYDHLNVIEITSKKRKFIMCTDKPREVTEWVAAFHLVGGIAGSGVPTAAAFAAAKAINEAATADRSLVAAATPTVVVPPSPTAAATAASAAATPASPTPASAAAAAATSPVAATTPTITPSSSSDAPPLPSKPVPAGVSPALAAATAARSAAAGAARGSNIAAATAGAPPIPKRPARESTFTSGTSLPAGTSPLSSAPAAVAASAGTSVLNASPLGAVSEQNDPFAPVTNTTPTAASSSDLGDSKSAPAAVATAAAVSLTASSDGKSTTASAAGDAVPNASSSLATSTIVEAAGDEDDDDLQPLPALNSAGAASAGKAIQTPPSTTAGTGTATPAAAAEDVEPVSAPGSNTKAPILPVLPMLPRQASSAAPAAAEPAAVSAAPVTATAPTPVAAVAPAATTTTQPLPPTPSTSAAATAAATAPTVAAVPAATSTATPTDPAAAAPTSAATAAATPVPAVSAAPRESILSPKAGTPLAGAAKSPPPLPPAISRASKPAMTGFVLAQHQKAAAVIAAAAKQQQQPALPATPSSNTAAAGAAPTATDLTRKSPLTKTEETTLSQWLPLGSKTVDQLDQFFAFIRTSLSRHKWHFVLESHVVMAASLHKTVATHIYQNWAKWLFPLMQRQSEKQMLMDKESEQHLLALVTLLISTVHFRRFGLDVAAPAGPSDRVKLEELASTALSGLQKMMDRAAASSADSKSKTPPAAGASTPAVAVVEDDIGTAISALINLISDFCWNDGTVRVVRMILSSFLNLVLKAAQNDRGWRNQVTHPGWKNLLSVLSVLEEYVFCRPLNAKKMGVHLSGRGCLDLRLVSIAKSILDALPIHTLDAVPDSNPITAKLQKQIQTLCIDEIAFWGCAKIYFEKIGQLALVLPTSIVVDAKAQDAMKAANAELAVAQTNLTQVMASRKRFGSFWTANKVKPESTEMFIDIPNELRQRKNSKFMQPAVQFATLQDATTTTVAAAKGDGATAAAGQGGVIAHRPSTAAPEFEEEDELTKDDVEKLMNQCRGEPISNGSFGRVFRVQLFASWWACKIINAEMVSRVAIRSEIRVHRKLRSRRCVMFRGCWTKGNPIVILSEWGGHDLHQFIHPKRVTAPAPVAATEQKTPPATAATAPLLAVVKENQESTSASAAQTDTATASTAASASNTATPSPAVSTSASPAASPYPSIGQTPLSSSQSAIPIGTATATASPSSSVLLQSPTAATSPSPTAAAPATAASPSPTPAPAVSIARPVRGPSTQPLQALTDQLRAKVSYQIAEGLNELHHQQPPIVHRDLKPSNVLIDKNFDVKLCDFGFSHSVNASSLASSHSDSNRKNGKAGTPLYKAPETWDPDLTIDVASDVYSLGIVLHELWSSPPGLLPWSDKSYEQLVALHLIKRTPPPIDVSITTAHPQISAVIEWCTRPDRKQRPKTEQLIERLQQILPEYGMDFD